MDTVVLKAGEANVGTMKTSLPASPWSPTTAGRPEGLPLIDMSTPESLERDFYAWLWGGPKLEDSDGGSDRSASACSSDLASDFLANNSVDSNNSVDNNVDYGGYIYGGCDVKPMMLNEWHASYYNHVNCAAAANGITVDANNNENFDVKFDAKNNNKNANNNTQKSFSKSNNNNNNNRNCHNKCAGTNQLGRIYSPGLPLSMCERERIVDLYRSGWKICDISKQLCVTHSCVSKILHRFRTTGTCRPKDAKEGRQESPLVEAIRDYRTRLGLTRQSEIREQLIRDGWYQRDSAPSRSSINHILRTKLDVRKRKK